METPVTLLMIREEARREGRVDLSIGWASINSLLALDVAAAHFVARCCRQVQAHTGVVSE